MYDVATNLHKVKDSLPDGVRLIAISKYHPNEYIEAAYNEGQRMFGESHEQELSAKAKTLPTDIEWHFIGHLQSNKVKYIAPYISMIEAVDTLKLLKEINKQAAKLLEEGDWCELKNVHISGLMMMASNTDDTEQIRREMTLAANFFDEVKAKYFADDPEFKERSWGMSSDYEIAIDCRSTMIRVGTAIFGPRVY